MASPEPPDERLLEKAGALLAKASSTAFAEERQALALRAYSLIAAYLNACEADSAAPRRRERRLLRDRRQGARAVPPPASERRPDGRAAATAAYRRVLDGGDPVGARIHVDV